MSLTNDNAVMTMPVQPAYSGSNCNGMGWGGDWMAFIVLFLLFGMFGWGGFGGFGGFGGGSGMQGLLTRGDLCQDMNFNNLDTAVRSGAAENNANFRTVDNAICTLGYQNAQLINGIGAQISNEFRGTDNAICTLGFNMQQGFNNVQGAVKDNTVQGIINTNTIQQQISQCCCENEKIAMQNRFDNAQANCATLQAIDKVGDRIIDYLAADKAQALRDENQALRLEASQQAQNNYLVNQLRPCPTPAYITCNPWAASYGVGFNNNGGCGCNSGCGC